MMPLVYFKTLPSYVDRMCCLLLEKSLHSLCITIYVHIFTKVHVIALVFCLHKFFYYYCIQPQWSSGYSTGMQV
jgi:hypothetical protein